jgi:hypothetical protein
MLKHFQLIDREVEVAPLNAQLEAHPELWDQHGGRKGPGSPHNQISDIWVRYNRIERLSAGREHFNAEHVPVWYPAWNALPALRPIIFNLMAQVEGEMIGAVFITRVPPGAGIDWHVDEGWHVETFDKFYLSLQSAPGANFYCQVGAEQEALCPKPGEIWLFDNRKFHAVHNGSEQDRMTCIICIRTERFGRR